MELLQLALIGLAVGAVISLGSMGLTIAYGVTKFANIAHGDYMTLGMFVAYAVVVQSDLYLNASPIGPFSFGWTMLLGIAAAMLTVGLVAVVIDALIYKRLRSKRSATLISLAASIGVALMLRSYVQAQWGVLPVRYSNLVNFAIELPGGLKIRPDQLFILGIAALSAVALYFWLYRTRAGKALRATADNSDLAEITGIDTNRVRFSMWFVAGGLSALSGVMLGIQSQLKHNAGFELLLSLFAATLMGGIGNPWGALIGGIVVGIVQETSTYWLPSGLKNVVPFVVLILVLLLRPRGLFGSRIL